MSENEGAVTILALDDEPTNNALIERVFRKRPGYRVFAMTSGNDALAFLEEQKVDVMLVDQSMPHMTGVEFLEQSRVLAPDAVSIMVTGYPELDVVIQAQDQGLVRHIVAKPWKPDDLLRAVDRAISVRDMKNAVANIEQS